MVLGHLFEMRNRPVARRRVAEEPALDAIVHAAAGHRERGSSENLVEPLCGLAFGALAPVKQQKEIQCVRLREFWRRSETAVRLVVAGDDGASDRIDGAGMQVVGARAL